MPALMDDPLVSERVFQHIANGTTDMGDANDVFTFGRFESAIVHFHRQLDEALDAA